MISSGFCTKTECSNSLILLHAFWCSKFSVKTILCSCKLSEKCSVATLIGLPIKIVTDYGKVLGGCYLDCDRVTCTFMLYYMAYFGYSDLCRRG